MARFPNNPVRTIDGLHWNILELYRNALAGLRAAAREAPELASVGIDSWAVDYALLRGDRMLGNPVPLPGRPHRGRRRGHPRPGVTARELYAPERPAVPALQHAVPAGRRPGGRRPRRGGRACC